MLWEIDVFSRTDLVDRRGNDMAARLRAFGYTEQVRVVSARSFLLEHESFNEMVVDDIARRLLADAVAEQFVAAPATSEMLLAVPNGRLTAATVVHVLPKRGVMDPVAQSAASAIADLGHAMPHVRTGHKYWISGLSAADAKQAAESLLANDAIEQVVVGPLVVDHLSSGLPSPSVLKHVELAGLDDVGLMQLSRSGQLYLQLAEMQTLQKYFAELGRAPTDIELETIAQTWSEHCSHKTLGGRVKYTGDRGTVQYESMLKETIFAATRELRRRWGDDDWCVSVFVDNAGVVKFDDEHHVCFKVETHNHPSAIEPYGGANTGLGGVIRDILGTGLGAKPICNTDVFCFAPPDHTNELPQGVLHPQLVMQGVVAGVRDYGNRMGIPTVNGAICFDERYLGNPLVFCGSVGLLPHDKAFGQPQPGDFIVAIGGRTGRDGIHGATFSSAELTSESETLSGGAVQIGNAIEEKKVQDVLLAARDRGLFTAVTDCGAGGFSSAVGEMGEQIGAEVWLEQAPLKYEGLSYTEIWISEAQERMVVSVPESNWQELEELCRSEDVEATRIGRFEPTGRLLLKFHDQVVGDLDMQFLHDGRPPVVREARYHPNGDDTLAGDPLLDPAHSLLAILGSLNVASKEWVIRQYDHEVQGGSVVKSLVGPLRDGPGDAAVVRPVLTSNRAVVIGCGINPHYGDLDTYHMAASAIDEAIRNCVAVGADPSRIALLDNFCWGDCERAETFGALVRAAQACHDLSLAFEAPFISGKDSLNNEFSYVDADGKKHTIAIPPTLLISAMGQMTDAGKAVTMDLKSSDNHLFVVGVTLDELGGSHYALVNQLSGGSVPKVEPSPASATFAAVHRAIEAGSVAACHDCSEGGLAVALAEMAFAGGLGVDCQLVDIPSGYAQLDAVTRLFSESNSRFVCEVADEQLAKFSAAVAGTAVAKMGQVTTSKRVVIRDDEKTLIDLPNDELKRAWQSPLAW